MWEMDRKAQVFLIIIAAALLFAGGYKYALFRAPGPESEVTVTEQVEEAREMETLGVHVAGAVNKPGVYQLGQGARVEDAVFKSIGRDSIIVKRSLVFEPMISPLL
jgi:competence protein ComEA